MSIIQTAAEWAQPVLNMPYVLRTRRNHGLEHATIHVLSRQRYTLSGRSNDSGFVIFGEVPTETLESGVKEALHRMRSGQHSLAIHPNCGTNLVTTGFLATLISAVGFSGKSAKRAWDRFPLVMVVMMMVVLFSPVLGMSLQRYFTTEGDPGNLELVSVVRSQVKMPFNRKPMTIHRVITKQE